ncbi:MAG: iron transporter [Bacillota bacterium]
MIRRKGLFMMMVAVLVIGLLAGCAGTKDAAKVEESNVQDEAADGGASFQEYPIGDEVEAEGMNIAAIYLKPVDMEPAMKAGLSADKSDIHLEADITALKDNPFGFGFGEFVPYLTIKYIISDESGKEVLSGSFMPMNASDGSHYGANVKMPGAGTYKLKYIIESPENKDFLLHTDDETGVPGRFWKKPVEVEFEFPYVPRKF